MTIRKCRCCGREFETRRAHSSFCERCRAVVKSVTATLCNKGVEAGPERRERAVAMAREKLEKRGVELGADLPPIREIPAEPRRKRQPNPRKRTCACGEKFLADSSRQRHCTECAHELKNIRARIYARIRLGLVAKEMYAEAVETEYRKHVEYVRQRIDEETHHRCPFCGSRVRNGNGAYCSRCYAEGLNQLHQYTGRSNGWDRKTQGAQNVLPGWRGQPRMGTHAKRPEDWR